MGGLASCTRVIDSLEGQWYDIFIPREGETDM